MPDYALPDLPYDYLPYRNDKAPFVQQWWNIVNWADGQNRFARAKSQTQELILP